MQGIALTAADNSLGQWQFSLDNGTIWTNVPTVSNTNALLLPSDANTRLRANSPLTAFGTVDITFRAWDQTSGTAGDTADASTNGGSTAFSSATGTATELVTPYSVSGSTLTVTGTPSADQFSITVGASSSMADMDGITQNFSTPPITNVIFNGGGGADVTTIVAEQGAITATFNLNQTTVTGSNYTYQINNSPTVYVFGASGDTATMNDTASDDVFTGLPAYSVMNNATTNPTTYWHEAIGFGTVNAVATTGTDNADLYDSSGNDTFTSNSTSSQMAGTGYQLDAAGFETAYGFFSSGADTANIGPTSGTKTYVYGTSADTANLTDSAGNDTFTAVPAASYSVLQGSGYYNEAISFGTVQATSSNGGTDTANFYDTTGNDTYNSTGNVSSLTSGGIVNNATGFAVNYAFLSSGTDTANLHAGTNRTEYLYGTANDTVNFFSSFQYRSVRRRSPYSLMYYNNYAYYKQASGFGTAERHSQRHRFDGLLVRLVRQRRARGRRHHSHAYHARRDDRREQVCHRLCLQHQRRQRHQAREQPPFDFVFNAIGGWTSI